MDNISSKKKKLAVFMFISNISCLVGGVYLSQLAIDDFTNLFRVIILFTIFILCLVLYGVSTSKSFDKLNNIIHEIRKGGC